MKTPKDVFIECRLRYHNETFLQAQEVYRKVMQKIADELLQGKLVK